MDYNNFKDKSTSSLWGIIIYDEERHTLSAFDVILILWREGQFETVIDVSTLLLKVKSINLQRMQLIGHFLQTKNRWQSSCERMGHTFDSVQALCSSGVADLKILMLINCNYQAPEPRKKCIGSISKLDKFQPIISYIIITITNFVEIHKRRV